MTASAPLFNRTSPDPLSPTTVPPTVYELVVQMTATLVTFAFAMPPGGKNAAAAKKVVDYFTSPDQAGKVREKGLEPR